MTFFTTFNLSKYPLISPTPMSIPTLVLSHPIFGLKQHVYMSAKLLVELS